MKQKAIKKTTEGELQASAHLYTHDSHICEYAYIHIHITIHKSKSFHENLAFLYTLAEIRRVKSSQSFIQKKEKCKLVEIRSE